MRKKLLAIILTTVMALSLLPMSVFADEQAPADDGDEIYSYVTMTEEEFRASSSWAGGISLDDASVTCIGDTLTGDAATVYNTIANADGVSATSNSVQYSVTCSSIDERTQVIDDIKAAYGDGMFAYLYDHPAELEFCPGAVGLSYGYSGLTANFTFRFEVSASYSDLKSNEMATIVAEILSDAEDMETYFALKYFHDWLCKNNDYYSAAVNNNDNTTEQFYVAHTQYGCLVEGTGVCESYAKAFKILCDQSNIPCLIVVSATHAWNYVLMDDEWYMVDCTWDDPVGTLDPDYVRYDYFLTSNNPNVDSDHTTRTFNYPATSESNYEYSTFKQYSLTFALEDIGDEEDLTVKVPADGAAYIVFTPTVTGMYVFEAFSGGLDTKGYIAYKSDEEGETLGEVVAYNDDKEGSFDFLVSAKLQAGTAYVFWAKMNDEDESGTFKVTVSHEADDYCAHDSIMYKYLYNDYTYTYDEWYGDEDSAEGVYDSLDCLATYYTLEVCEECEAEVDRYLGQKQHTTESKYFIDGVEIDDDPEDHLKDEDDIIVVKEDASCTNCDFVGTSVYFCYVGNYYFPYCNNYQEDGWVEVGVNNYPFLIIANYCNSDNETKRYTGIAYFEDEEDEDSTRVYYYFNDGVFDPTYNGTVEYQGEEVTVVNGIAADYHEHSYVQYYIYNGVSYTWIEWYGPASMGQFKESGAGYNVACDETIEYAAQCTICDKYYNFEDGSTKQSMIKGHDFYGTSYYVIDGQRYSSYGDVYEYIEENTDKYPIVVREYHTCRLCEEEGSFIEIEYGETYEVEETYADGVLLEAEESPNVPYTLVWVYKAVEGDERIIKAYEVDIQRTSHIVNGLTPVGDELWYFDDGLFDATKNGKVDYKCAEYTVVNGIADPDEAPEQKHTVVTIPAKEATCTEPGLTEGKQCSVCKEWIVKQTETEPKGHTDKTVPRVAPTCTKTGLSEGIVCKDCGIEILAQSEIPANGHTSEYVDRVAATCTESGLTEGWRCKVCKEWIEEPKEVPALGHDIVTDSAKEPTCTETGLTAGSHCTRCSGATVAQSEIPAKGHNYQGVETQAPTCTIKGLMTYTCSSCGVSYQENTDELGHDMVTDVAVEATCTETGLSAGSHCSRCDEATVGQTEIPALGHDIVTDTGKAATCTESGLTEGSHCSRCDGATVAQTEIPALGHDIVTDTGKAATCTESGLTDGSHCSRCDGATVAQKEIPAKGHSYNAEVTKAPTCTEKGVKTYTCTAGDDSYTEDIDALGHKFGDADVIKVATFTEEGIVRYRCLNEGCTETKDEPIPVKNENRPDGLANSASYDGNWYYFKDNKVATDVTTVANNSNGWFYVENGKVNFSYTGLAANSNGIWYIKGGKVDFSFKGLYKQDGAIRYLEGGCVKTNKTDVLSGTVLGEGDGESGWWNVVNGTVQHGPTLAHNSNGWWYIDEDGKVDFGYNGLGKNANGIFVVKNGKVDFSYKGFYGIGADKYAYFEGGQFKADKTEVVNGTVDGESGWWNVVKGLLEREETVANNSNGWWYIGEDGKVDFSYNGYAYNENGGWFIKNGKVDFSANGIVYDGYGIEYGSTGYAYYINGRWAEEKTEVIYGTVDGESGWWNIYEGEVAYGPYINHNSNGWWYIGEDGKVDFSFKGISVNENGEWYCEGGKVQFSKTDVLYATIVYYDEEGEVAEETGWFNIEGGKLVGDTVAKNSNGWWYINESGMVDFDYTGLGKNASGEWYCKNGKVDFSFSGTFDGKTIVNGKVQ